MKNKILLSIVSIIGILFIVGCSNPNLDKYDAGFAVTTNALIEFREPCVDADVTNDNFCKIDDELYRKVDVLVDAADLALDEMHAAAADENSDQVDYWLQIFLSNYDELKAIVDRIKENI